MSTTSSALPVVQRTEILHGDTIQVTTTTRLGLRGADGALVAEDLAGTAATAQLRRFSQPGDPAWQSGLIVAMGAADLGGYVVEAFDVPQSVWDDIPRETLTYVLEIQAVEDTAAGGSPVTRTLRRILIDAKPDYNY